MTVPVEAFWQLHWSQCRRRKTYHKCDYADELIIPVLGKKWYALLLQGSECLPPRSSLSQIKTKNMFFFYRQGKIFAAWTPLKVYKKCSHLRMKINNWFYSVIFGINFRIREHNVETLRSESTWTADDFSWRKTISVFAVNMWEACCVLVRCKTMK